MKLILLLLPFVFTGCALELRADGTKRFEVSPTSADYKAIRHFTR